VIHSHRNNTGVTAIIDERGRVTARLPQFTEGLLQGDTQPFAGATPFVRYGDSLALLLCVAMGIAAGILSLIRARRQRR
jgi:apolipoprotein N-acyltransferase